MHFQKRKKSPKMHLKKLNCINLFNFHFYYIKDLSSFVEEVQILYQWLRDHTNFLNNKRSISIISRLSFKYTELQNDRNDHLIF